MPAINPTIRPVKVKKYMVSVAIIILLYGFNHLDSIMDFGDSIMVRGKEEKQRVIKDRYTGG